MQQNAVSDVADPVGSLVSLLTSVRMEGRHVTGRHACVGPWLSDERGMWSVTMTACDCGTCEGTIIAPC